MTLTLNFQGQIRNFLYLSQKWSDCHETKSKHICWNQGPKYDHQLWPGLWPWPIIFKVIYGICYIPKLVRLPQNEKQIYRLKFRLQMWPSCLTLAMTLTLNFQGQIWPPPLTTHMALTMDSCISEWEGRLTLNEGVDHDHLVTKVRCEDLPDSDRGDFRCRRAVDSFSCIYFHIFHTTHAIDWPCNPMKSKEFNKLRNNAQNIIKCQYDLLTKQRLDIIHIAVLPQLVHLNRQKLKVSIVYA